MFLNKIWRFITNEKARFGYLNKMGFYRNTSDIDFIKRAYYVNFGKKIDLKHPVTFNEKLQWLKLYDRRPEYTTMVDKYAVKQYVAERIGEEYIIPTLGVWDKFEDIDFDQLPNQFVLKCTHDSGGLVICRDKSKFDIIAARKIINKYLRRDFYSVNREWPYKNVKHRIIAEAYMEDNSSPDLTDYKFYCFNGEPRFLYVSQGLSDHSTASISFLTLNWKFAPYERTDFKPLTELPPKPKQFEKMVEIARVLSHGIDFLRVDLYEINEKVYFSELTFSPGAGLTQFKNPEHDVEIGAMLELTLKGESET